MNEITHSLKNIKMIPHEKELPLPSANPCITSKKVLSMHMIPTFLGVFGFLLVFIDSVPSIIHEWLTLDRYEFMSYIYFRSIQLFTALLIAIYFYYSYLYQKRTVSKKLEDTEKKHQEIVKQENLVAAKINRLQMISTVKTQFQDILKIYHLLEKAKNVCRTKVMPHSHEIKTMLRREKQLKLY